MSSVAAAIVERSRRPRRFRRGQALAAALTAVALVTLLVDKAFFRVSPAVADHYHARVRQAVDALPFVVPGWVGVDVAIPQGATAMLHPNAILCRRFTNLRTNESLTLLLVHVRDTRDILGHYPPVCYPGQGWTVESARAHDWAYKQGDVQGTEYVMRRAGVAGDDRMTIDNFLILPGGGTYRDMQEGERAAQSRLRKVFGAGQFQFVAEGVTSDGRRRQIVEEFLRVCGPVVDAISAPES
jgi:hypothetical protein